MISSVRLLNASVTSDTAVSQPCVWGGGRGAFQVSVAGGSADWTVEFLWAANDFLIVPSWTQADGFGARIISFDLPPGEIYARATENGGVSAVDVEVYLHVLGK